MGIQSELYGLVVATDCSSKAGQLSNLDTRPNMAGFYRPTEGVKMGDYGTWAPCNLGADPSITLSKAIGTAATLLSGKFVLIRKSIQVVITGLHIWSIKI